MRTVLSFARQATIDYWWFMASCCEAAATLVEAYWKES